MFFGNNLQKIPVTHPKILYKGRWHRNQEHAIGAFPGVSIAFRFGGRKLYAYFEQINSVTPNQAIYICVIINGQISKKYKVTRRKRYLVFDRNSDSNEYINIEIFKCSEAYMGELRCQGFEGDDSIESSVQNARKLLVIGDSFSAAMGNMGSFSRETTVNSGIKNKNQDNYFSYCAYVARYLEADYSCVAYSGKGLYRDYLGNTENQLPDLLDRVRPDHSIETVSLDEYCPRWIFVCLGVNDFHHLLNDSLEPIRFVEAYLRLLEKLFRFYPDASITLFNYPLLKLFIENGFNSYRACDECIEKILIKGRELGSLNHFEYYQSPVVLGEQWHPFRDSHEQFAKALYSQIKNKS